LQGPFSAVVDKHVRDPWLKSMLNLECFVLSGMLAKDTLAAEMVFMFMERGQGRNRIDYPVGCCVDAVYKVMGMFQDPPTLSGVRLLAAIWC
jgi:hypothetical protein